MPELEDIMLLMVAVSESDWAKWRDFITPIDPDARVEAIMTFKSGDDEFKMPFTPM